MSFSSGPRAAVIVVAAGSGTRLAAGAPKAFVRVDRESMLSHAVRGVAEASPAQIIVVAPSSHLDEATAQARAAAGPDADGVVVVVGGDSRQASVAAGLAAVRPDLEFVLVHDAARALTPASVFDRVLARLGDGADAVVPVLPVIDTIKRVHGDVVVEAVDRADLSAAQTPQGFRRRVLDEAYRAADAEHTDDTALVQAAGTSVVTVAGDERAFKITTPADLDRARMLLAPMPIPRIGVGTDVHAFGGDGALWLAGLEWPGERGLHGHSDGDAVAHAIVDAVLAAAGLGDIGMHFGTDRPEYAGAHAAAFLERVRELVTDAGWRVGNVSVQVQSNRPRMSARRAEAEGVLSRALGCPVALSATTTDGLGFTGAGDGVAAFAVALVVPA